MTAVEPSFVGPETRLPLSRAREPERPVDLDSLLRERFQIDALYDWQRDAVRTVLEPKSRLLLVAPTGGGKSLCYQLPAVALPGTTLVLSPLISLMEDQVRGLEARGIPATFIASSLPREENSRRLARMRAGEYKIVYAAPERLAFDGFLDALHASDLSLVAVDEAHCIVQWGHDFRPDYLRIGDAVRRLAPPRVLACTATATPDARDEIIDKLGWREREPSVILRGFARPNLHLEVRQVGGPRDALAYTVHALEEALGDKRSPDGAAIVYAATRKSSEQIADKLSDLGWRADAYHAGLDPERRARVSRHFASRKISVVVATNAFGMGIDRPDVRVVVHAQPPSSIEAYYQEVGRAGRDGLDATGLLCIASQDIALRRRLCELGSEGSIPSAAQVARAWNLFRELLRYVDASTCRHDFILRYFGDEAEAIGGCGHCDVCMDLDVREKESPETATADVEIVRKALAGVARAKGSAGMIAVASMLAGEITERVKSTRLDRLSTFGILAGKSPDDVLVILRVLLANGWIDLTSNEYPVPLMTPAGWKVMKAEVPIRVRLPATGKKLKKRSATKASKNEATRSARAEVDANQADRELFDALRRYRAKIAKERGLPAYVIATDRTLLGIATTKPSSLRALHEVHGMGPARMASFGEAFLEVVRKPEHSS